MKSCVSLLFASLLLLVKANALQNPCEFNDRMHNENQEFPPQCPPPWLSLAARSMSSRTTFAQKLAADDELQPHLDKIAAELYKLRDRRVVSENPCQKDTEDLVEMARTAHNKKLAFGFGCSSQCLVNVGDFHTETTFINTAEGRTETKTNLEDPKRSEDLFYEAALERGNAEKELVRDARMASNAAILIVPACLAFIPLSLFHEVDAGMALLYAVLTDVVTVIPLAIKGVELIMLGGKTTWATQAYVYGMERATIDGIVELWTASCRMEPRIRRTGIFFLCLAMALIVIGLLLEIFFAVLLQRQKNAWDESERTFPKRKRNAGVIWYWRNHWRYARPAYQTPMESYDTRREIMEHYS